MGTWDTTGTGIVTEGYEKQIMKRRSSYENILDAESDIRSGYSHHPKRVGTVPGKASLLKSNASDPCILSSIATDISNESPDHTQGNKSLDSGIPGESLMWGFQVTSGFLVLYLISLPV